MITAQNLKRDILEIYEDKFQGFENIRIKCNAQRISAFIVKTAGVHSLDCSFSVFEFTIISEIEKVLNFASIDEIEISFWHGTVKVHGIVKVYGYAPYKTFKML